MNPLAGTDLNNDTNANDRPPGVGRNSARGFDYVSLDVRVLRRIAWGSNTKLDLLVEAFNVMNRKNYLLPNNVFGTGATPRPTFGQPGDAADPRQVQFGVRLSF